MTEYGSLGGGCKINKTKSDFRDCPRGVGVSIAYIYMKPQEAFIYHIHSSHGELYIDIYLSRGVISGTDGDVWDAISKSISIWILNNQTFFFHVQIFFQTTSFRPHLSHSFLSPFLLSFPFFFRPLR